jgi:large subunit ribosomal protein L13
MTGNKMNDRVIWTYSGFPGGQKERTPAQMMAKDPTRVVEHAIKGMLPKNRLGREVFRNLHIYAGNEHPHIAQNPKSIELQK